MKSTLGLLVLFTSACLAAPPQKLTADDLLKMTADSQQQHQAAMEAEKQKNTDVEAARDAMSQQNAMLMQNFARSGGYYGSGYEGASLGGISSAGLGGLSTAHLGGLGAGVAGIGSPSIGIFPGASSAPCQIPFLVSCSPTIIRGKSLSPCAQSQGYGAGISGLGASGLAGAGHISAPVYRENEGSAFPTFQNQQLNMFDHQPRDVMFQDGQQLLSQQDALMMMQQNNQQMVDTEGRTLGLFHKKQPVLVPVPVPVPVPQKPFGGFHHHGYGGAF